MPARCERMYSSVRPRNQGVHAPRRAIARSEPGVHAYTSLHVALLVGAERGSAKVLFFWWDQPTRSDPRRKSWPQVRWLFLGVAA